MPTPILPLGGLQTAIVNGEVHLADPWDSRGNAYRSTSPRSEINVFFESALVHDARAAHRLSELLEILARDFRVHLETERDRVKVPIDRLCPCYQELLEAEAFLAKLKGPRS